MTLNLSVNVYININFLLLSSCFKPIFSLPVEVRHGKRKMIQKRETSAGLWYIFCHVCTCISLTTNNLLVMCNTTYNNYCGIRNFQHEVLTEQAETTSNETGFENQWVSTTNVVGSYMKECVRGQQWSLSFLYIFSCCKRPLLAGNEIFPGGGISSYSHIGLISGPVFSFFKEPRIQMVTLLHHKTEI